MIQISSPRNEQVSLKSISEQSKKYRLNYPFQPNDNNSCFDVNYLSFDQIEQESNKQPCTTLKKQTLENKSFSCNPINNFKNSFISDTVKKDLELDQIQIFNNYFFEENRSISHLVQKLLNKNLSDMQIPKYQNKKKLIQLNENQLSKLTFVLILFLIGILSPTYMVLKDSPFKIYGTLCQITLLISSIILNVFLKRYQKSSKKTKKDILLQLWQDLSYELIILLLLILSFVIQILQLQKFQVINIIQTIACILSLIKNLTIQNHATQVGLKILFGNFIFLHLLKCYQLSIINLQQLDFLTFCRKYIFIMIQCNILKDNEDNINLALLEMALIIFYNTFLFQVFIYLLNLWRNHLSFDYLFVNKQITFEGLLRNLSVDFEKSSQILKETRNHEIEDFKYLSLYDQIIQNQHFHQELGRLLFQQSKLFEQFSQRTQDQLIKSMELHLIHPQQIISCDQLYEELTINFIIHGTINLGIQNNQVNNFEKIEELIQGQHFGQLTFFTGLKDCFSYQSDHYSLLFKLKRQTLFYFIEKNSVDKEQLSIINQTINKSNYSILKLKCQCCNSSFHILSNCPQMHLQLNKDDIISQYLSPQNQERKKYLRLQNKKNNILKLKVFKSILSKSDVSKIFQKKQNNNNIFERKSSAFNFENNSEILKEFKSEKILDQQILSHYMNSNNSEDFVQELYNDTLKKSKQCESGHDKTENMDLNKGLLNLDCQEHLINHIKTESKPFLDECESSNMVNNLNSYKSRQMSGTYVNSLKHQQFISLTGQMISILNNELYNQFTNLNIDKWQNYEHFEVQYNFRNILNNLRQNQRDRKSLKNTQDCNMSIKISQLKEQGD
ncbi:unnamed protein product [Paramecium sonneborni]|uniref:Cyclic nucleotide-binding domain-containing protein n=1 Tax=Paramecium sonneborni TaxID=65129 RepID=A0A8S1QTZ2_9CILI|nr:unnamed protein product [Paramecium sonneborni]